MRRLAVASSLALAIALLAPAARAQEATAPVEAATPDETPEQWGRGPLEVRDPFISALSRLSPWARSPRTLERGEVEVGLRGAWTNSYAFAQGRLVLDAEVRQLLAVVRVGVFDRLELGLTLPFEWRGGGVMDGFIEGFHEAFGLPEQERDRRPRDRFLVVGQERDRSVWELGHPGSGFGDLIPEVRALLVKGDDRLPAVALTLRLRLPTGRPRFELSHGVDVSLAVDVSKRLGRLPVIGYLTLAYTHGARGRVDHLEVRRHRAFVSLGLEWEITPWLSFVVHSWWESERERALWDDPTPRGQTPSVAPVDLTYGNYVTYIAAGFKLEPTEGLLIEVGMLEDIVDPETTADFGLLGNVSYRF